MPQLLPTPIFETLVAVADRMASAADPWWVIGSAAAVLHGLDADPIGDVDIITSVADARRLLSALDVVAVDDDGTGLFRSEVFAPASAGTTRRVCVLVPASDLLRGLTFQRTRPCPEA